MDAKALRSLAGRVLKREGLAGTEASPSAMERAHRAAAAIAAGRQAEESDDLETAYRCYADAAVADPDDGAAWYDMARVLINANALISPTPRDVSAYPIAHGHLREAIARGHEQARAVEDVLRGFSTLHSDERA
jgi:tetratricopeptide (TPR) repeat protein